MARLLILVIIFVLVLFSILWFQDWWPWAMSRFDAGTSSSIQAWEAAIQIALNVLEFIILMAFGRSFYQLVKGKEIRPLNDKPAAVPNPVDFLSHYYYELYSICAQLNLSLIDSRFGEYYRKADITLPRIYQDMDVIPWREDRMNISKRQPIEGTGLSTRTCTSAVIINATDLAPFCPQRVASFAGRALSAGHRFEVGTVDTTRL